METERRQCRSSSPGQAVGLYLQSVARRAGMRAIALADEQGLLVAGSGDDQVLEQLAAVGAAREADAGPWRELLLEVAGDSVFKGYPLNIGGLCFCIAALGGADMPWCEIEDALGRILRA
jgi:hypothetical protein